MASTEPDLPLVLLPGLICDRRIWAAQIAAIDAPHILAFDDYLGCDQLGLMAERALAAAPERFCLAGHSMGARVALEVYRLAPQRVAKLALLDTGAHPVQPGERDKRYALRDIGRSRGMDALIDAWLPPMLGPRARGDQVLMTRLREMCRACGMARFESDIQALLSRPGVDDVLSAISCPTLIGVGRQDQWSPVAQHEAIASRIKRATLRVFEDCGHMAPAEAPDAVTAALAEWLAG